MGERRQPLGERLVSAKVLTPGQLRTALAYQQNQGGRLGEIIVMLGMAPESQVMSVLSSQLGVPYKKVGSLKIPEEVLKLVPRALMERRYVLPLAVRPGNPKPPRLLVAMAEPQDLQGVDEVAFASGTVVTAVLTSRADIDRAFCSNGIHGGRALARQLELEDDPNEEFVIVRDASILAP